MVPHVRQSRAFRAAGREIASRRYSSLLCPQFPQNVAKQSIPRPDEKGRVNLMNVSATRSRDLGRPVSNNGSSAAPDYAGHLERMQRGGTSEAAYRAAAEYYRHELLPLLPEAPDARCVDVGSGYGHLARFLLDSGRTRVGAVDSSKNLLDSLRDYIGDQLEFTCHEDGVDFLARHEREFDCVIMFDVLEHIEPSRHEQTITSVYRALRPGGRFIVRVPNMANLLGAYSRYLDYTHQFGFTEFSLFQLFQIGGFPSPQVFVPRPHGKWKHQLRQRMSRWVHRQLLKWDRRSQPQCLDKNVIVWAAKEPHPVGIYPLEEARGAGR